MWLSRAESTVSRHTTQGAPAPLAPGQTKFNDKGRTPAGLLAHSGSLDELDELLGSGREGDREGGGGEGNVQAEAADAHGETPLHIAAMYGQFEVVKFLIRDHSVAVDPVNWEGWTPLLCAVSRSHIEVADFLLRNGANLHHTAQPSGMTAMHVAAWFAQRDAIEYLLAKRASLNKENAYGVPPIGLTRPGPIKRLMFNAQEELHNE